MADHWQDETDEASDELQDFRFGGKDAVLFLIDATPPMHVTPSESMDDDADPDTPILSHFQMAVKAALHTLRSQILSSPNDLVGILLYGTKKHVGVDTFENLSLLCPLSPPEAGTILRLEKLLAKPELFDEEFGQSDQFSLYDALWKSQTLFGDVPAGKIGTKKILLITNQSDPHQDQSDERRKAMKKASDLFHNHINLDVLPLGRKFEMERFFKDLVQLADDDRADFGDPTVKLEDLLKIVRKRIHKKRSTGKVYLEFGPNMKISLNTYNFISKSYKPSKVKLAKDTNEEVVVQRNFFHPVTGAPLLPSDIKKYQEYGGKRIKLTQDETKAITMLDGELGMKIVGFKPLSALKWGHYVRSSGFIYPEEKMIKGSRQVFAALLIKCLEKKVMAVCSFKARDSSGPSFVALVPQEERKDYEGHQIAPPGFHVVFLPFADDFRATPTVSMVEPEPEQLSAAKALVKKIKMKGYHPEAFSNPDLQFHYAMIEAMALERDDVETPKDDTMPDMEFLARKLKDVGQDFLESVYPEGYDPQSASTKRKAPAAKKEPVVKKAKTVDVDQEFDMGSYVESKTVPKLTVQVLKDYLKANDIDVAGLKKAQLVDEVYKFFNGKN